MTTSPFVWAGRVLSGAVAAFLALDAALKLGGRSDLLQAGIALDAPPATRTACCSRCMSRF